MAERIALRELDPPDKTQLSPEQVLDAGAELIDHFDVKVDPVADPEAFVDAMDQLNPRFQGARPLVRFELEEDQTEWPEETKSVIMRTSEATRMLVPQTPLEGSFDTIISLAGARQANLDRMRYAARCLYTRASLDTPLPDGTIRGGSLVFAGSLRPLSEAEKENVSNYALGAETEADLVEATLEELEDEQFFLTQEFRKWPQIMNYGMVIADGERVGTPQVVETVLKELTEGHDETVRGFPDDYRLGAVTTQIYQVATELDLARVAKRFGITQTFTAGNPSDPSIIAKRTPATYFSEDLRTLKAAALAKMEGVDTVGLSDYPIRPYPNNLYI